MPRLSYDECIQMTRVHEGLADILRLVPDREGLCLFRRELKLMMRGCVDLVTESLANSELDGIHAEPLGDEQVERMLKKARGDLPLGERVASALAEPCRGFHTAGCACEPTAEGIMVPIAPYRAAVRGDCRSAYRGPHSPAAHRDGEC